MVPRLDVIAHAVAVVLEDDCAAERGKITRRQLWLKRDDLFVERHYAALTRAAWKYVACELADNACPVSIYP